MSETVVPPVETPAPVTPAPAVTETPPVPPPTPPAPAAPVIPETYATFATPEGYAIDEGLMGKFTPLAKELGLTQAAAQKLVDFQIENVKAAQTAEAEARAGWTADLKNHPEIGGANFEANMLRARGIAEKVLGPEKSAALLALGDWPPLVELLHGIAKRTAEGTFGGTGTNANAAPSHEEKLKSIYNHPSSQGMFKS